MNALQYLFVLAINVGPKDTRKCMCFKPKAKPEKFFPSKKKKRGMRFYWRHAMNINRFL